MRKWLFFFLLLLPLPALAAPKVVSEEDLFAQLAKAQSADEAKPIEDQLAGFFRVSGSASVDLLMSRAQAALADTDNATAAKILDAVTRVAPDYAEGWRQRAELKAAAGDDAGAMLALQKTVLLNPRQFDALAELAGMLEDYGDKTEALKLYRRALALDPQLPGIARAEMKLAKDVEGQGI